MKEWFSPLNLWSRDDRLICWTRKSLRFGWISGRSNGSGRGEMEGLYMFVGGVGEIWGYVRDIVGGKWEAGPMVYGISSWDFVSHTDSNVGIGDMWNQRLGTHVDCQTQYMKVFSQTLSDLQVDWDCSEEKKMSSNDDTTEKNQTVCELWVSSFYPTLSSK